MPARRLSLMDERDDSLAQLYRRSSREEPPARLDLAVMEMARKSVSRRAWSPFANRWQVIGTVAAVALVSVVLVVLTQKQTSLTALPQASRSAVPASAADAGRQRDPGAVAIRLPLPPPHKQLQDSDAIAAGRRVAEPERQAPAPRSAARPDEQAPPSGAPAADQPDDTGPSQPRFDFQTLPEAQVDVPQPAQERAAGQAAAPTLEPAAPLQEVIAPLQEAVAPSQEPLQEAVAPQQDSISPGLSARAAGPEAASATAAAGYYLQIGAFREANSASRYKTRLESLGLPAGVETITLANQEAWHRVRVGPYRDMSTLDEARRLLNAQGIDSLLVTSGE